VKGSRIEGKIAQSGKLGEAVPYRHGGGEEF